MEPPPRPKCKNCERYIESLLAGLKEEVEENERLSEQVNKLKQKNSEEKKRHNDTNNQIIMSNVKYQQALHEAHKAVLKYNRERDEFVSKEIVAASLKTELEAVRNINKQLLDILQVNIADLPVVKPKQTGRDNQSRDSANTAREKVSKNTNKGLHVRTASEANSETYLSVAAKMLKSKPSPKAATKSTTKETEVPKPASKIRVFEDNSSESDNNTSTDSNMSIDYGSDEDTNQENEDQQDVTTHNHTDAPLPQRPTQQSKIKEKHSSASDYVGRESKSPSSGLDQTNQREQRGAYQFRRSKATSYAEPSLRVKMRRGDSHTNIIPEYVVRPYIRPYNNENAPP